MAMLVLDPYVEERLKAEREASGADRYDEVWEGIYMMAPLADDEHQDIQMGLGAAIKIALGWTGPQAGMVRAGVNVSDREQGWTHNYRIPDVAVFFPGGAGRNCGAYWVGGPDFAVEIVSSGDRARDKLNFYAGNKVRELLLIDRLAWSIEMYHLRGDRLVLVATSDSAGKHPLKSQLLPVTFRLLTATPRPQIEVAHDDGVQRWLV